MKIQISRGSSRMTKVWTNEETKEEYRNLPKKDQDNIKDVGGFVLGKLKDGSQKKENVISRSSICLDKEKNIIQLKII